MGIWNHLPKAYHIEKCPFCEKEFKCFEEDQTPGFRDTEDKVCPYCGATIETSMTWEFHTYKMEENV